MNVIVIVADSLRVDHVGCYGGAVKTPNIDRLAAESAVLEQAYGENLPTMPCRTAWWTGQYLFTKRPWQPFEVSDYLLAEFLWDKGFTSALVTDTYHMHKPGYNCGRGFDTVSWIRGQEYDPWIVDESIRVDLTKNHRLREDPLNKVWKDRFPQQTRSAGGAGGGNPVPSSPRAFDSWEERFTQYLRNVSWWKSEEDHFVARVVKEAIRWLENVARTQKDNLFLWVDSFSPHEPWDPPSPYREMYDPNYRGQEIIDPVPGLVEGYMTPEEVRHTKALYGGVVTLVDKWVGILLDRVRELGLMDNTLIMFTSDHGEPFGDHGIIRKAQPMTYEEVAHIPWIIRHPAGLGRGKRFGAFAQPPDLMPTILDALGFGADPATAPAAPGGTPKLALGVSPSSGAPPIGVSLLPLLAGQVESVRPFAVTASYNGHWGIRTEDWHYFIHLRGDKPPELYDRKTDLRERHNVFDANREVGEELELRLRRFAAEV